jgi:predicted secreted protein
MKARWIILGVAGLVVIAAWSAVAITYFFFDPSIVVWTAVVTVAAFSLEGLFWVAAGVLGWSFLAGRRSTLQRWKQRIFGPKAPNSAD